MAKIVLPYDFQPRPYQVPILDYLNRGGKRAFWVVHRRAGKDLVCLNHMACAAMERVGLYFYLLPTLRQGRKVIWDGMRNDGKGFISSTFPKEIIRSRNESDMKLVLVNGSIVQVVGSDAIDAVVGTNPVGVVLSEYALTAPTAFDYIRPILAANDGWAVFNTTPRGLNHAYKLFKLAEKDPSWFTLRQSIYDTHALPASIIDQELAAGMPPALVKSEYLVDWNSTLVGAIYGDLMEDLQNRGGVCDFDASGDAVFTSWDLGVSDSTAIWWFRVSDSGVEFIDYYENHGKPLSHYAEVIEGRGHSYIRHWLPHDSNARNLGSDLTVLEQLRNRFGADKVAIGPRLALLDGIQAGRWLLQQKGTRFHESRCATGLEALRAYSYSYDDETRTFSNKPAHDWSSHAADAFRYAAIVSKVSGIYKPRPAPKPVAPIIPPAHMSFTLEQLYDIAKANRSWRKRVA